jgi:hypothetical protein
MIRCSAALSLLLALVSCRTYDYQSQHSDSGGLVPGDQFASYGGEQAQAVAIARAFAKAGEGTSPEALGARADSAVAYARTQPGVADAVADPLDHRLTVTFKSGWRLGIVPLGD